MHACLIPKCLVSVRIHGLFTKTLSPPAFVAQTRVTLQWCLHKADLAISPLLRRLSPCNLACDGIKV